MRKLGMVVGVVALLVTSASWAAPIVWTGPTMTFTKAHAADWTLAANQDHITDQTWITRKDNEGIFNIAMETTAVRASSPLNTEWSYGQAADWATLTFGTWFAWQDSNPSSTLNRDAVLHLVAEDIYIDIKFLSWEGSFAAGGRGGFSYERSTAPEDGGAVPEPATMTLVGLGLGGVALLRRRKA